MILALLHAPLAAAQPAVLFEGRVRTPQGEQVLRITAEDGRFAAVAPVPAPPSPGPAATRFATAGFVDAHCHPGGLGRQLAELDLTGATTYAEVLARIAAAPGSGWLTGRGWDQNDWSDAPAGGWPLASDLADRTDRPVAVRRIDGHALWVSPNVLSRAGIDARTPDPQGGRIVRDAGGHPAGVLVDTAMDLVAVPAPSAADLDRQLRRAVDAIAAVGLTGVHDMGAGDGTIARYQALDDAGTLPIRVWVYATPDSEAAQRLATTGPWHGKRLSVIGVKLLADGALGSRGAWLSADYSDEAGHRGAPIATHAEIERWATKLLATGAQLAVHAIGDAAVHDTIEAFAAARAHHPDRDRVPLRLEHAQVMRPADTARLAALGIVASMQPTHATSDMPWAEARLGPERIRWGYRWREVLDAGAVLAFGSDFPVEGVDPSLGMWAATTRTAPGGKPPGGWFPDQRLTDGEALAAFTSGAAAAAGLDSDVLAPGQPAALTVWREEGGRWIAERAIVP